MCIVYLKYKRNRCHLMIMEPTLDDIRKYEFDEVNLSKGEFQHNLICGDWCALGERPKL